RLVVARTVYGSMFGGRVIDTFNMTKQSSRFPIERMRISMHVILSTTSMAGYIFHGFDLGLPFATVFALLSLTYLSRLSFPPLLAYFAASSDASLTFLHEMQRLVPGTVAAMLDINGSIQGTPAASHVIRSLLSVQFDFRQSDKETWPDVVESIMDSVPLIVIDARVATPAVEREARTIVD